jgi:hypothetical protein
LIDVVCRTGRELTAHADERASAPGWPVVRVEAPGNIAMFERLGFTQVAIQQHPKLPSAMTVTLEKPVSSIDVP